MMGRRRNQAGGASGSSGMQAKQLAAGKNPLPPPAISRVGMLPEQRAMPVAQSSGSGAQVHNPIKPGRSLHRAGTLHLSRGKMPKYNP